MYRSIALSAVLFLGAACTTPKDKEEKYELKSPCASASQALPGRGLPCGRGPAHEGPLPPKDLPAREAV